MGARHSRATFALPLSVALVGTAACAGMRPSELSLPPPPAPMTPEQGTLANEAFARAVSTFEAEVGRIAELPPAEKPASVQRAIDRLADAIAQIPLRGGLDLGDATARIKRLAASLPAASPDRWTATAKLALTVAVANLHLASTGPYANAPRVEASVTNFQYGVAALDEWKPRDAQLPYVVVALQGAGVVLRTIELVSPALE